MDTLSTKPEFLQLIHDNQRVIYKICHLYCNNATDREDLARNHLSTVEIRQQLKEEYKFSTWMYRIA